jgi:hypothetical protein
MSWTAGEVFLGLAIGALLSEATMFTLCMTGVKCVHTYR